MVKEAKIELNAVTLNYVEGENNGSELLLLHGSSSRLQTFNPIIPHLTRHSHLFALDLRGHGLSSRAESYLIDDYVNDIRQFIEVNMTAPVVLYGNSLGGMIAFMLAAQYPHLINKLIIGDAPLSIASLRQLISTQRDFALTIIDLLRKNNINDIYKIIPDRDFAESVTMCDYKMLSAIFNEFEKTFSSYQPEIIFPALQCQLMLLRGDVANGSLISDDDVAHLRSYIPSFIDIKIPAAGHSLTSFHTLFLDQVIEFIKK